MSKFLWILGATTLGVAVYVVMSQQFEQAAPIDGVDTAAGNIAAWGAKQRLFGAGGQLKGKVEQGVAGFTGDQDTADKGVFDETTGAVKDAAGKAAQALGSTIHNLNG